jgi:hypothetical protein
MSPLGETVPARSITITGPQSTVQVEQGKIIDLTYGSYTLDVAATGFAPVTMPVVIDQPAQILTVAMKLGRIEDYEPPACSIIGSAPLRIKAARIRAVQLFGPYVTDVPVDAQGRFEVRNLVCGDYLLIVTESSRFVGTMVARSAVLPKRLELSLTGASDPH